MHLVANRLLDLLGEPDLRVSGVGGVVPGSGVLAAGRHVQKVDTAFRKEGRQLDGLVQGPALLDFRYLLKPVGSADPQEKRHVLGDRGPNALNDFQSQPHAVLEAATVLVGSLVGDRREKFMQKIAVGVVDLDHVKSGHNGTHSPAHKVRFELLDLAQGHLARLWEFVTEWDCTGAHNVVGPSIGVQVSGVAEAEERRNSARFSSGVGDLDTNLLVLGVGELHMFRQAGDLGIEPDARIIGADTAAALDGGGLHDEQTGASRDDATNVTIVPWLLEPVDAGVLAERGDENAVLKGYPADLQRLEERGDGGAIRLGVDCGS